VPTVVQLPDAPDGVVVGLVIEVYAIRTDMTTQELTTMIVGLVVEFLLVQRHALLRQPAAQFGKQRQEVLVALLWHNEHDVIDKAYERDAAFFRQP